MVNFRSLILASASFVFLLGTFASAQDAEKPKDDQVGVELNLGEEVSPEPKVGEPYVTDTFGDWAVRCIKTAEGPDPCQLYQLILNDSNTAVAEISMVSIAPGNQAAAGATIAAPLETLLTEQITLSVDGGIERRYPFSWCTRGGCFARLGFTADDIAAYKRGANITMTIVPVVAADRRIDLNISLTGFTAAFEAVKKINGH